MTVLLLVNRHVLLALFVVLNRFDLYKFKFVVGDLLRRVQQLGLPPARDNAEFVCDSLLLLQVKLI